jgi:hypothetical protein
MGLKSFFHRLAGRKNTQQPPAANSNDTPVATPEKLPRFFIHFSSIDDLPRIMEFYRENPHQNVCDRNDDLMRKLADEGSVIFVEDEKGKIYGASISYPLLREAGDTTVREWVELGTTRMVVNGYPGLFDMMIAMQTLRAYLVEPPEDRFVCQMESAAVRKMAARLGFTPYTPTDEVVRISDQTISAQYDSGKENWYSAGAEALPVMAALMCAALDKPHLTHQKTGERVVVDFSKSRFFHAFENEIRALAARDIPNITDDPLQSKRVAENRNDWMKRYFR